MVPCTACGALGAALDSNLEDFWLQADWLAKDLADMYVPMEAAAYTV